MRAAIYTRVSHDPAGQRRSVNEQEVECRAEVADKGWDLIEPVYCDDDRGASRYSRGERPQWDQLLLDLRAGGIDVLVTWESSRAQRDLEVYTNLRRICRETGTLWHYDGHTYDLSNDDDAYRTGQDALDAEREAARIRKRVMRGVRSRVTGGRPHGKNLYGHRREYDPDTGAYVRTVPDPAAAPIVAEIFRRFVDGETASGIARALTKRGVPTPGSAPVWRNLTVRNILMNKGHLGHRVSAGEVTTENAWPALVDEATWWRAHATLNDPGRAPRLDSAVKYLLSGLALCGVCGGKMVYNAGGTKRKSYPMYVCRDRSCVSRSAPHLESAVTEYVLAMWEDDARLGARDADPRIAEVNAELAGLWARIESFRESAGDIDGPSPAAVAAVERKLTPLILAAERRLSGLLARMALPDLDGKTLREAWEMPADAGGLSLGRRRAIIANAVTVTVLQAGPKHRFDPATISIVGRWPELP